MKKFYFFIAVCLFSHIYAGKISLSVNYRKIYTTEKRNNIKDYQWYYKYGNPLELRQKVQYYIAIEGMTPQRKHTETLILKGLSVDREYFLMSLDSKLIFENNEKIERSFSVFYEGVERLDNILVDSNGIASFSFSQPGEYVFRDKKYPWIKVFVIVLENTKIYPVKSTSYKLTISDIPSGSYSLKFYKNIKWIYQEDFTVINNAVLSTKYNIVDEKVTRSGATAVSANQIVIPSGVRNNTDSENSQEQNKSGAKE